MPRLEAMQHEIRTQVQGLTMRAIYALEDPVSSKARSRGRRNLNRMADREVARLVDQLRELRTTFRPHQLIDLSDLTTFSALGGLQSELLTRTESGWRRWLLRRIRRS